MKNEINTPEKLAEWLDTPHPAVFHHMDLRTAPMPFSGVAVEHCSFIECKLTSDYSAFLSGVGCVVLNGPAHLGFSPLRSKLYSPAELYDHFDPNEPDSYRRCLDSTVYRSFMDTSGKRPKLRPVDLDTYLFRRLHDATIADALDSLMDLSMRRRSVAIMGGHNVGRDAEMYASVAMLALGLSKDGFVVLTGGGPGLMEAANLGAYLGGFDQPEAKLQAVLAMLAQAPKYDHPNWLAAGFQAWKMLGAPTNLEKSINVGIPTWFYGHEPPNVFATHIAKYFENSVREEGLLALALAGVVFAEGNAGTVQEIFQDACQNYYATYDETRSPMVLFGSDYWNPVGEGSRAKPAYPLLAQLAVEKDFTELVLLTDDTEEIRRFLVARYLKQ